MGDLVLYLGITVCGYILGSRLRAYKQHLAWTGAVQTAAISVLVLLMGLRMGSNEEVTENLSTIGLAALLMTAAVMICSIAAIFLVRKAFDIDRYGRLREQAAAGAGRGAVNSAAASVSEAAGASEAAGGAAASAEGVACSAESALLAETEEEIEKEKKGGNLMTLLIIIAVTAGMLLGYFLIREVFAGRMEEFEAAAGLGIKLGLCLLLIFVGMDLGLDGTVIANFRRVGLRILAFPAAVILGTLIGALAVCPLLALSLRECLAVGCGFGWYTLAPGIIMEAGHLTASAVSFLHNVMRELFSIILIPLVAKKIGYIETTGMPGAAAMDVCLPIVEKSTRSDIAVYSFVSGVIMSILVPVLVPLMIG